MPLGTREQHIQTVSLFILATIALCFALFLLRPILIPFILAVFLMYCLTPVIAIQMKFLRLPRSIAIVSTILIGCFFLVFVSFLVSTSVDQLSMNADDYKARLVEMVRIGAALVPFDTLGVDPKSVIKTLSEGSGNNMRAFITGTISGFMGILSQSLLVIIFMIFLLIGKRPAHPQKHGLLFEVEQKIKRYIIAMFFISAITGVLIGMTLHILGVESAFMFGFFAFLLNFIPNIGSIIATLLPLPVVLLNPELSPIAKVLAFLIPGTIQMVIGNLIAPKAVGDALELHPVVVLSALIFFGMIWGIVGMFLATPITAVIKIILKKFSYSKPLAYLMEGKIEYLDQLFATEEN
jgi:AI-2 transport protein TqsA